MTRLAVVALFAAATVTQVVAQTTYTDRASNLNIALTGYVQGDVDEDSAQAKRIRITTKDLVTSLGGGSRDRLVILTPFDYDGDTRVVMRQVQNRQNIDTDISGWFASETYAIVENSRTRNDRTTGQQYSIDRFFFGGTDDDPTEFGFDVQGLTNANLSNGGFSSNVNGTGYTPEGEAVVGGKVSASGGKNETFTIEDEED